MGESFTGTTNISTSAVTIPPNPSSTVNVKISEPLQLSGEVIVMISKLTSTFKSILSETVIFNSSPSLS